MTNSVRLTGLATRVLLGCALGVLTAGCGAGVGDVSGTVAVNGVPLVYGSVTFVGGDGTPHQGTIQPDGSYAVKGVPAGVAKVAVSSPRPPRPNAKLDIPPGEEPERYEILEEERAAIAAKVDKVDRKKWRPIDKKYADFNTSGLTVTVTAGPNNHNIELK